MLGSGWSRFWVFYFKLVLVSGRFWFRSRFGLRFVFDSSCCLCRVGWVLGLFLFWVGFSFGFIFVSGWFWFQARVRLESALVPGWLLFKMCFSFGLVLV